MTFIAEYGGLYSQEVKIGTGDFVKNVAVWNFVSTNDAWSFETVENTMQYQIEHPNSAAVANIHVPVLGEDPMMPGNAEELMAYYGIANMLPMTYLDNALEVLGAVRYEEFEAQILSHLAEYTPVGVSVITAVDGTKVKAQVDVSAVTAGSYGLGVWLVEDDVIASQVGTDVAAYYHQNVFRYNLTPVEGLSMGSFADNEQRSFSFTVDVSAYDPDNCKIVVYVSQDQGEEQASILNAQVCPIGQYRAYQFH